MNLRRKIKFYRDAPISHNVLLEALGSYRRPNDKVSEMIRNGELISLRRGLYVPGPEFDLPMPDAFVIANHLRGPSYISLETALSYWGFIPEGVHEVSSVTIKTTKTYSTPIGRFSFQHLPLPYYSFGIQMAEITEQQTALLASPEKAICDKIVLTSGVNLRSKSQAYDFLTEDLRIDEDQLQTLNIEAIQSWIEEAPKKNSLQQLVNIVEGL